MRQWIAVIKNRIITLTPNGKILEKTLSQMTIATERS